MSKPPSILPLKIFVISFGLLLIGSTIFVVAALVDKANKMQSHNCPPASISLRDLKVAGTISNVSTAEKSITVTVNDGTTAHVLTLDRCTGKPLQQLTITP